MGTIPNDSSNYIPQESFDYDAYERGEYETDPSSWHIPGISPLTVGDQNKEEIIDAEWEEVEDSCDAYRQEMGSHVVCIATSGGRELIQHLLQIEASKRSMDTTYNTKLIETIICEYHQKLNDTLSE